MDDFFEINKPKLKKNSGSPARQKKKNDRETQRNKKFQYVVKCLDDCLENLVVQFYQPILDAVEKLISADKKKSGELPSLFIRGHCVSWDSIFAQINHKLGTTHHLCCLTSADASLSHVINEIKENSNKSTILFVLQVECFARNSLLNNLVEFLVNSETRSHLVMATAIDYAIILDRITRLNYTFFDVHTLELHSPEELLNGVYDALLDGRALDGWSQLRFSGQILTLARFRYLYEDFSLYELRKCLTFALANYFVECDAQTLATLAFAKNEDKKEIAQRTAYVKVLNALLQLESELEVVNNTELFLKFHVNIQSDETFLDNHFKVLRLETNDWGKEKWIGILGKIGRQLRQTDGAADDELVELNELTEGLKKRREGAQTENAPASEETPTKKNKPQRACDFKKEQSRRLKSLKNLPSADELRSIEEFLSRLFKKFLVRFDARFVVDVPRNRLAYLETSNVRHLDEIMNRRVEPEPGRQLDVITLYHVLVDSNAERVLLDMSDTFEKFVAFVSDAPLQLKDVGVSARFFNALAQLEYMGVVVMSTDRTLRLVYLPTPVASAFVESRSDNFATLTIR